MAVIEEQVSNQPKSQPQTFTAPSSGYESDGYETASETDLNDAAVTEPPPPPSPPPQITNSHSNGVRDCVSTSNENRDPEIKGDETSESIDTEKSVAEANSAKLEGNSFFKDGLYEEALLKYEHAIQTAPDGPSYNEIRSICHSNRAACFSKLGKHDDTIKECTKALELNPTYMKSLLRRAEAREKLEQYEESIADLTKILELDPSNDQARRTIIRLKPLADEKREKMKDEMIGKLKEMGNSILGRFGMSVDNFKAVKDPNTGSYSISFQH